jgi:hypothetical protein
MNELIRITDPEAKQYDFPIWLLEPMILLNNEETGQLIQEYYYMN